MVDTSKTRAAATAATLDGVSIMGATDSAVAVSAATSMVWMTEMEMGARIVLSAMGIAFLALRMYIVWVGRAKGKDLRDG